MLCASFVVLLWLSEVVYIATIRQAPDDVSDMPPKKKADKKIVSLIESPALTPRKDPIALIDPRPLEVPPIHRYNKDTVFTSLSGRAATDVEKKDIHAMVERQSLSLKQLEEFIEAATITHGESQTIVESLRRSLMVARSHRVIIQRRLDSQTSIETEASLIEQTLREDRNIANDAYEVLAKFNKELDILHEAIEKDLEALARITVRIQELERCLVESSLKIRLESDSLRSFQYCRTLISSTLKRYRALLGLPALAIHEDLTPVGDPEPLRIPLIDTYESELVLLSLSNRTATDAEKKYILNIIQRHYSYLNQIGGFIKAGSITLDESQVTVDTIKRSLMVTRSHRVIIQRRLDFQTSIEAEASLTEELAHKETDRHDDTYTEVLKGFDIELAIVRQMIDRDLRELSKITIEIEKLEKTLPEANLRLQLESDSLKLAKRCQTRICDTLTRYRSLLHRGRNLPNELLMKIFRLMVGLDIDLIRNGLEKPPSFAVLLLSSICKHWRYVVHRIPYLWQYIPLPTSCDAKFLEVFRLYARNIVGTSHIIIHWSPKKPDPGAMIPDLLTYYLNTSTPSISETLSKALSIEFIAKSSNGGTLEVDCKWPATSYTLRRFIPKFTQGLSNQVNKLIVRTEALSNEQVPKLSDALRALPKLQYLSIHVERFTAQGNWGEVINLESLEILSTQSKLVAELLGTLIAAPNLRCLHINGRFDYASAQPDIWRRVVSQAGIGEIHKVVLENLTPWSSKGAQLLPILEGFVDIDVLELVGNFLSPILSSLTSRSLLLPTFQILIIRDSDIDGSILKQLLQSRSDTTEGVVGKSVIRKVELDGSSKLDLLCCEEIAEMVETLVVTDRCYFVH